MCKFRVHHGEGTKWCLQAKNYAEALLSDLWRPHFTTDFFGHPERLAHKLNQLDRLSRAPLSSSEPSST